MIAAFPSATLSPSNSPEFTSQPDLVRTLAVRRFVSAQGAWASLCYYLAPVLLVLSFVLHALRQKQVRSFGRAS